MGDNQNQDGGGKKKAGKKKNRSSYKDGVLLKVSDIERECDRLRRRPRAALYPLLPITEPLKLKRRSLHFPKGRRRHRKHCRKRLGVSGPKRRPPLPSLPPGSRSRLLTTTTSEVSSLACSKNRDLLALHNQQGGSSRPHWASAELFFGDPFLEVGGPPRTFHPRHHHYHSAAVAKKQKHRICHHDPLLCGHRTSATTSLKDLRYQAGRRFRRRMGYDPEAGGDKDSTGSNNRSRKIVSFIVASVASFILMMCVALVAVTLRLTPAIDEMGLPKMKDRHSENQRLL